MKKPYLMSMDELMCLPAFVASGVLERADAFGGCFRDRAGNLWGTCLIGIVWARFPAGQLSRRAEIFEETLTRQSALRGYIDYCDGARIRGWGQDGSEPDARITFDISVDGTLVGRTVADLFRSDLLDAEIGDGHHAFDLTFLARLSPEAVHIVVVQRSEDGTVLDIDIVKPRTDR